MEPYASASTPGKLGGAERRAQPPRLALYLPAAVLVVPFLMLFLVAVLEWRSVRASAEADLTLAADAAAEYAERALESFAALGGRVNDALRGVSDTEIRERELELHHELTRLVGQVIRSHAVLVLDASGAPLVSSQLYPVPRPWLDAGDLFANLAAAAPGEILLSRPFLGPFDQQLNFAMSRRRDGPAGDAAGADARGSVVVTIRPDGLADGFRRVSGPAVDTLSLVLPDGHVLTRSIGHDRPLPPVHPRSGYHAMVRSGVEAAVYPALDLAGNLPGIAAARRLHGFAVYATSRRSRSELLTEWRGRMAGHLMIGVPATLGLLALALQIRRDQSRLSRANARLGELVEANLDRLTRAHRFGLVGTFEYDVRSGANFRSREYLEIHGLPPETVSEAHEDWLRRLHPEDRDRANRVLQKALAPGHGVTSYAQSYRIILPDGGVRWIAARAEIERDAEGHAVTMRGAHVDVTPLRTTEHALAESDARLHLAQEALSIGTWEWMREGGRMNWSGAMLRLWGFAPDQAQPRVSAALRRIHPEDRRRVLGELSATLRSGLLRSEFRILRPGPTGEAEVIWIVARAKLLPVGGDATARLLGVAYDATDRKQAEAHAAMLAHEVEHRAKNALAVVMSLLRMTDAPTVDELKEVMQGRIGALARTMGLLGRQHWSGAVLGQVIEEELAPFRGGGEHDVTLEGPEVMLERGMVQPLSMAVHELATNAAKYGALGRPGGRLELRWSLRDGDIHLLWREVAEPHLQGPPTRASFGIRLIDSIFQEQLGGRITRHWGATGLVCDIVFPAHGA